MLTTTTIVVTTLADEVGTPGEMSLRQALHEIQTNAPGNATEIDFAPSLFAAGPQTMTLDGTEFPQITGQVYIRGPSYSPAYNTPLPALTIDAGGLSRIFDVSSSGNLSISSLTMTDGFVDGNGGAISDLGGLTLTNCSVLNSTAAPVTPGGGSGGGIYAVGGNLQNCIVSGNKAGGGGGGIDFDGSQTEASDISASTVSNNTAAGNGGGLQSLYSFLAIQSSVIDENQAGGQGGGLYSYSAQIPDHSDSAGNLQFFDAQFLDNQSTGAGGGIYAVGSDSLAMSANTILTGNSSDGGGGMFDGCTTTTIANTTIAYNNATIGGAGSGGGLVCTGASLSLTQSTIANNVAASGGGLQGVAGLSTTLLESTIADNTATTGPGGGLELPSGSLISLIQNSTIAGNAAVSGGGIDAPQAVVDAAHNLTIQNTIVATNTASTSAPNIAGAAAGNYNLVDDVSGATLTGTGNITGLDPMLAPLAYNDTSTPTMALLAGSPAIDAGDPFFNVNSFSPPLSVDQNNFARGQRPRRYRRGGVRVDEYRRTSDGKRFQLHIEPEFELDYSERSFGLERGVAERTPAWPTRAQRWRHLWKLHLHARPQLRRRR